MNEVVAGGESAPGAAAAGALALGGALSSVMDELAHGVLLASPQGRVLHANHAARRELARRQGLAVQQGHLQASDAKQSRELLQALARGGEGRRSLVGLRAGPWTLSVAVLPVRGEPAAEPGTVALVLSRAVVCDSLMLCFFARAHGLTHSEEQVLSILCQGCSAPQAAARLNVAVSTVRTHVRSLCTKTQSHGVRALLGRVAVLPPLGQWLHSAVH